MKAKNPGRPTLDADPMTYHNVSLTPKMVAWVRRNLGKGQLSRGIREAIRKAGYKG